MVLVTRNCQEATTTGPGAPRQGCKLNTTVHTLVGAPGKVTDVGALAPTTEVLPGSGTCCTSEISYCPKLETWAVNSENMNLNVGYVVA